MFTLSNILSLLNNEAQKWFVPVIIIIITLFLSRLVPKYIFLLLDRISKKTGGAWHETVKQVFKRPISVFIALTGIYVALGRIPYFFSNPNAWIITTKCFRTGLILIVLWGLYNLCGNNQLMISSFGKKINLQISSMLLPVLSKTMRIILIVVAFLIIAEEWNYPISALLTGLGLGGLAFALAAQDMLSNIFGGIVILFDKPFDLGDWIETAMATGTVEEIGFRSVKIRTFSKELVTVPNSSIANSAIKNYSRREKRGASFNLGLRFETPLQSIKICTEKIKTMIMQNDDVDKETIVVVFDNIGDSSLNLAVHYFTKTIIWAEHLKVKEKIYYEILDILASENVEIAFPTQTLHVHKEEK